MVTGRTDTPALVLALGLAVPLVVGGGSAVVALMRPPMESNAAPEPVVATVGRAERLEEQATTVTWVPVDTFAVRSQSAGISTALSIVAGTALADGDVAMVLHVTAHAVITWTAATIGVLGLGLLPVGTLLDVLKERS